ncbi:probable WRKY transcription factor 2 [Typha angustifolia]|uniref:probable WRKY transcription factor 2 n=1 Tax=Typha angustifolia TaxID=59011 RepID=UPI003C2CA793
MDDGISMIGDWMPPNPSPRTLVSNFLNGECSLRSFSDMLGQNGSDDAENRSEKHKVAPCSMEEENQVKIQNLSDPSPEPNLFGSHKANAHGGLAERMAARAGFNIPKLNTSRVTPTMVTSSTEVQSPYLTIPPGLSPTTLLESPVFLSNAMAQPSPTTGKFPFLQSNNANLITGSTPDKIEDHPCEDPPEPFAFKPPLESNSSYFLSAEKKGSSTINNQHSFPSRGASLQLENVVHTSQQARILNNQDQDESNFQAGFSDSFGQKDVTDDKTINQRMSDSFLGNDQSSPPDDLQDAEADPKGEHSSVAIGTPADDGYNWRKYGQKQVKNSEYPRSYYKCTQPNCQVKKKVERSHEGHITEIIYKGQHNHPKPPPNRRSGVPSLHPFNDQQIDGSENPCSQATLDAKSLWENNPNGTAQDWRGDGLEATSSASAAVEYGEPSTPMQTQDGPRLESADALDFSSTLSNNEDEDDRATHCSVSLGCDGEGDETESKRRKLDACTIEMSAASRAVREPRVVVQTTSEVDILDDGYRWRKYGQKVVKGNPNPRSYYKCTNPGCSVRKHVERASHDLKSVITTYEGKHNHDVPAARNSSQASSASGASTTAASQQSHNLHRRPEPIQDSFVRFNGTAPLSAFGLPPRDQLGSAGSFSFGMGQAGLPNNPMAGLGSFSPFKLPAFPPPVHTYLGHRQTVEAGYMIPKGEPKEEPMSESTRLTMANGNSSAYQQMMSRLPPLGPQM